MVACECVRAQFCQRLNCFLFFLFAAVVGVLYFHCTRVRVRSRACVCVIIFVSAYKQFFKFTIVCVIYFVADARAIFVGAYNYILFYFRC